MWLFTAPTVIQFYIVLICIMCNILALFDQMIAVMTPKTCLLPMSSASHEMLTSISVCKDSKFPAMGSQLHQANAVWVLSTISMLVVCSLRRVTCKGLTHLGLLSFFLFQLPCSCSGHVFCALSFPAHLLLHMTESSKPAPGARICNLLKLL